MATNIEAGVEIMDQLLAAGSGDGREELVMQSRILASRAQDERRLRQKIEDELKFSKQKLQAKDRQIEEERAAQNQLSLRIVALQRTLDQKDSVIATLNKSVAELRESVVALSSIKPPSPKATVSVDPLSDAPMAPPLQRRLSMSSMLKDKVTIVRLKRQLKGIFDELQRTSAANECAMMELEDHRSNESMRNAMRQPPRVENDRGIVAPKSLISFDSVKRSSRGQPMAFQEPIDLKTPEENYLDTRVKQSAFHEHLGSLRTDMMTIYKDLKSSSDASLSAMLYIFSESEKRGNCILTNPKEDFTKELRNFAMKIKKLIFDTQKKVNKAMIAIVGSERGVRTQWLSEAHPSKDVAIEANIPPPEDPRIAALGEKVEFLMQQLGKARDDFETRTGECEMRREKAEINMLFLQRKVLDLHQAVHDSLHAVYKHRFKWTARMPNQFQSIDKDPSRRRQLEVQFVLKIGEATDHDIEHLRRFGEYFVSDDLFGTDQSSAHGHPSNKENDQVIFGRRKQSVQHKATRDTAAAQQRKVSNAMAALLQKESASSADEGTSADCVPAEPLAARTSATSPGPAQTPPSAAFVPIQVRNPPAPLVLPGEEPAAKPRNITPPVKPSRRAMTTDDADPPRPTRRVSAPDVAAPQPPRVTCTPSQVNLEIPFHPGGASQFGDPQGDARAFGRRVSAPLAR